MKIVVVEDEKKVRDTMVEMLQAEKFDVFPYDDGECAIKEIPQIDPDLILCDILMPDMDGFEVLERLREERKTSSVPFIFVTGLSVRGEMRPHLGLKAEDFISKPFTRVKLREAIDARLNRGQTSMMTKRILNDSRKKVSDDVPADMRTQLVNLVRYSEHMSASPDVFLEEQLDEIGTKIGTSATATVRLVEKLTILFDLQKMLASGRTLVMDDSSSCLRPVVSAVICNGRSATFSKVESDISDLEVMMDSEHLKNLFLNMIEAIEECGRRKSKLYIETRKVKSTVRISVTVSENGLRAGRFLSIREQFATDALNTDLRKLGVTMSVLKYYADLCNAKISITDTTSGGVRIVMELPAAS